MRPNWLFWRSMALNSLIRMWATTLYKRVCSSVGSIRPSVTLSLGLSKWHLTWDETLSYSLADFVRFFNRIPRRSEVLDPRQSAQQPWQLSSNFQSAQEALVVEKVLLAELGGFEGSNEGVVDVEQSYLIALFHGEEKLGFVRLLLFAGRNNENVLDLTFLWEIVRLLISIRNSKVLWGGGAVCYCYTASSEC